MNLLGPATKKRLVKIRVEELASPAVERLAAATSTLADAEKSIS